ncbi:MAG TPA: hypothetical protein VGR73_13380 [Bryobacteraceae bacterium]|nr:hypothetical protein [Bryobacteraceae bacterium]
MKGAEFLRAVKRIADERGIEMRFEAKRGKGSHGPLYFWEMENLVQNPEKELPSGTLHAMLPQLGLPESDLGS